MLILIASLCLIAMKDFLSLICLTSFWTNTSFWHLQLSTRRDKLHQFLSPHEKVFLLANFETDNFVWWLLVLPQWNQVDKSLSSQWLWFCILLGFISHDTLGEIIQQLWKTRQRFMLVRKQWRKNVKVRIEKLCLQYHKMRQDRYDCTILTGTEVCYLISHSGSAPCLLIFRYSFCPSFFSFTPYPFVSAHNKRYFILFLLKNIHLDLLSPFHLNLTSFMELINDIILDYLQTSTLLPVENHLYTVFTEEKVKKSLSLSLFIEGRAFRVQVPKGFLAVLRLGIQNEMYTRAGHGIFDLAMMCGRDPHIS